MFSQKQWGEMCVGQNTLEQAIAASLLPADDEIDARMALRPRERITAKATLQTPP